MIWGAKYRILKDVVAPDTLTFVPYRSAAALYVRSFCRISVVGGTTCGSVMTQPRFLAVCLIRSSIFAIQFIKSSIYKVMYTQEPAIRVTAPSKRAYIVQGSPKTKPIRLKLTYKPQPPPTTILHPQRCHGYNRQCISTARIPPPTAPPPH